MRKTLLVGWALTLIMFAGPAALAQTAAPASATQQFNRDVGQDRSVMKSEIGGIHSADAHIQYDNRRITALSIRIAHETGARKTADIAEKRRVQADEAIYRSRAANLNAEGHMRQQEYQADYAARDHRTAPKAPATTPPPH